MLLCDKSSVNEALSYNFVQEHKAVGNTGFWLRINLKVKVKWGIFFVPVQSMIKYLPAEATLVKRIRISTKSTQSKVSLIKACLLAKLIII